MTPNGHEGDSVGPFRLDRRLGSGGMGTVYLATDTRLDRPVALKLLAAHLGHSEEFLARFNREATVLGRLDSPHIIPIYDHGRTGDNPYLVMQYAAGGDLGAALRQYGPMPVAVAAEVCAQVADALAVAHAAGVVHRDIKPGNVLLRDARLHRPHVYLCDFGVAFTEPTGLTRTGAIAGTWNYLAPERTQGDPGSPASDIYAVGCLLHELLTGRPPYTGTDVEVAMAHLEAPVRQLSVTGPETVIVNQILARAMAKDPHQRFGSATELRRALRALVPTGLQGATSRPSRGRRGLVAGVAAATAVVLIAGAGVLVWRLRGDDHPPAPLSRTTPSPSKPTSPIAIAGDVDGDRKGDILTIDESGSNGGTAPGAAQLFVHRGNGFSEKPLPDYTAGATCETDVDGDGRLDFLSLDGYESTQRLIMTSPGTTRSSYSFAITASIDEADLACGDFNGDGLSDALVWGYSELSTKRPFPVDVYVILRRADGSWAKPARWARLQTRLADSSGLHFLVGDLNGDHKADLVANTEDGQPLDVQLSSGRSFTGAAGVRIGDLDDTTPALGDIDGDGRAELVTVAIAQNPISIWRFRNGAWKRTRWTPTVDHDLFSRTIGMSDLDGDGKDDLVVLGALEGGSFAVLGGEDGFERVWSLDLPGIGAKTNQALTGSSPAWTE